jgi:prophage antirepressor-like protein
MNVEELKVVQETEILGKKIKMYGDLDSPWFLAKDVAEWIDYSKANGKYQVSAMIRKIDDEEKGIKTFTTLGGDQEAWFLTEEGLYESCMKSTKPIAKQMKKEIKKYLKQIRLTGAAIPVGEEKKMVSYYFSSLSENLQNDIVTELINKNKEYQQFYNDLLNTEGLMDINTVAKELNIGEYKLFEYLRKKKIMFFNNNGINVPFERFRKEGKFQVRKVLCRDGKYRDTTLASNKGLEYIRKQLRKDSFYVEVSANA